jgi:MFS family permease
MAGSAERSTVKVAAIAQGIALVTFPAASTVFTDPDEYDLSTTQYGAMFVPQALTAIASSLLGAVWSRRFGPRRVYLLGLAANLTALTLLLVSVVVQENHSLAYGLLLMATASLGVGFGFTVPALNTFTAAFYPERVDASVLVLNALLGLGTALAPLFVAVFVGLGFWWGLPALSVVLLAGLLVVSLRLPFEVAPAELSTTAPRVGIPPRFFLYAAFALAYGICETMNGNWSSLDMKQLGASTTEASLALTAFWAMVTVGRVLFAAIQSHWPTVRTYRLLPFFLAATFVLIAELPSDEPAVGILAFGLAGFGCSALLPLTISFGQEELVPMAAAVAGGVIAFYQLGYGIAAFGAGPLQDAGIDLSTLFGVTAIVALAMGALGGVIVHPHQEPAALHPRPSLVASTRPPTPPRAAKPS